MKDFVSQNKTMALQTNNSWSAPKVVVSQMDSNRIQLKKQTKLEP